MAVRTYITETEFAKIDNPQSSTTYIVLDDNDPTIVKKVVFKTNNINNEGEVYIVQDEYPTPSGTIEITANANNIDVKQYATANVNVPNPSTGTLNITSNATYDVKNYAFAEVNVPNPSTGTLNITSNATYDVKNYASAQVNVPQPSGKITISQNGTDIDITQYAAADVNVSTGEQKTCKFKINSLGMGSLPTMTFNKIGEGKYYLKKNDGEWTEYTTSQSISVSTGTVIELKSDLVQKELAPVLTINDGSVIYKTPIYWEIEGDLLGTLYGNSLPPYACNGMFNGCKGLQEVPANMFANYSVIPNSCCKEMFKNCSSLTVAPALSATTLAQSCYQSMFFGCSSLTTASTLSATTLANNCCREMFKNCSSLTVAPALSATTLAQSCYESMFSGCSSLTTAPELPATTLANNCYWYMFNGCTSLTTAPELPATTLQNGCYWYMFNGCTILNYVKCLATTNITTNTVVNWLGGVAATGTFVKDANTTWPTGTSGIPDGWAVEDAA